MAHPRPPLKTELGDINNDYIDDLHARMFLLCERELATLEKPDEPDPFEMLSKRIALIEKFLRVRKLTAEIYPKRHKRKKKRR